MFVRPTTKFKRPITECAQCGERLLMPGWSENVDVRRVRHLWECKACDYAFENHRLL